MLRYLLILFVFIFSLSTGAKPIPLAKFSKKPKLVLVLVIDQFRSDFLTRFQDRFGKNGFRRLMQNGAYFPFGSYQIMQSMTCPGHATILSGALPYQNGIPLNDWFDRGRQKNVYCAEDTNSPLIGGVTPQPGMSPKNLNVSTVGDELKNAGYKSKVVAIALKDRSAIMLGGHRADMALWFEEGKWISSKYYFPDEKLPAWLMKINEKSLPLGIKEKEREMLSSPVGTKMTTQLALAAVNELKLGKGSAPDLLAVSYSSHDLLGHGKGPNAKEMEDFTIDEDREFGNLLDGINRAVPGGLANVVVVLTADHGIPPTVEYSKEAKIPAGRLSNDELMSEMNKELSLELGEKEKVNFVSRARSLNFYLNPKVLADKKLKSEEVEAKIKKLLQGREGIQHILTRSELAQGQRPAGFLGQAIRETYIPEKNGDIVIIPKSFWMETGPGTTHMTSYAYDRQVPILFMGPGFQPGVYADDARVIDIAPTLSFVLGTIAPSGSEGRVLKEALGQ